MTYLHLLACVRDAPTTRVLLRHAPRLAALAAAEAAVGHRLGRLVVDAWASSAVSAATRLRAYLTLRALVAGRPDVFFTPLLKLCVAAYRRRVGARSSPRSAPRIAFAVRSLVELTAVDVGRAYTLAFGGIRDAAVTLRGALTAADKVAGRLPVLSWPFLNSLRLWAAVLCAAPDAETGLGALVYPFVQVCLGAASLAVTPRTYPVRFHLAGWLVDVQAATGAYVPLAPPLLEVLQCAELRKARSALPTAATPRGGGRRGGGGGGGGGGGRRVPPPAPPTAGGRPIDWRTTARVSDAGVRTAGFRAGLVRRALLLLGRHAAAQSRHVAFPELVAPTVGALKRFAATTRVADFRADAAALATALAASSAAVSAARAAAPFGPRDAAAVCGAAGAAGMQRAVLGGVTPPGVPTPVEAWYRVEAERVGREDALRDAGMDGSDDEGGGGGMDTTNDGDSDGDGNGHGTGDGDGDGSDGSEEDDSGDEGDAAAAAEPAAAPKGGKKAAAAKERAADAAAATTAAALRAMQRPVRLGDAAEDADTVGTLVLTDSDEDAA